jgi:CRISPR-associated protein Csm4
MSFWQLVKIDFENNPVHFGELGIGMEESSERIRSDTLFSAWVSAYAQIYPDRIEELFDRFLKSETPPFQVSSTFLYGREDDNKYTYYLPTLLDRPRNYPPDDLKFAKSFRKLKYVPLSIWQRWYQGEGFTDRDRDELQTEQGELTAAGTFTYPKIFKNQTLPKVAVDRIHHGTNFYQTSFIHFQNGGLYFLFYMPTLDEDLLKQLKAALHFLGDEGIGGERSSGAGRFKPSWSDLDADWLSIVNPALTEPHYALISLFWDSPDICYQHIEPPTARYQLQERGGWISARSGRQLRRQSVRMFVEGSIFPRQPQGKLAIVTPIELQHKSHHPIYRSGVSLSLPVTTIPL